MSGTIVEPVRSVNRRASTATITVQLDLTPEQLKAVQSVCDTYRLALHEVAKSLILQALDYDYEFWALIIYQANQDRDTGRHPGFTEEVSE